MKCFVNKFLLYFICNTAQLPAFLQNLKEVDALQKMKIYNLGTVAEMHF
jgi:hypothetical protein